VYSGLVAASLMVMYWHAEVSGLAHAYALEVVPYTLTLVAAE